VGRGLDRQRRLAVPHQHHPERDVRALPDNETETPRRFSASRSDGCGADRVSLTGFDPAGGYTHGGALLTSVSISSSVRVLPSVSARRARSASRMHPATRSACVASLRMGKGEGEGGSKGKLLGAGNDGKGWPVGPLGPVGIQEKRPPSRARPGGTEHTTPRTTGGRRFGKGVKGVGGTCGVAL
jgi:hypothetical protein